VKLIYSRVYAKLRNQQFFDLASLNLAIKEKIRAHNQTRMHQKEYSREEKFIAFELKYYRDLKVAKNNHIYLGMDKHYYSDPYAYVEALLLTHGNQFEPIHLLFRKSEIH